MNYSLHIEQPELKTICRREKGLKIMPLADKNGQQNFSDQQLAQVYRRIVREETVNRIFYDGSVRNTTDFIRFMRATDNEVYFVWSNGREVGFFWLNGFRPKSAFINYCFFKGFWGDSALKVSRQCLDFIFAQKDRNDEHRFDVLLGLTPANNKLAIKFLLKNGMTIMGKVPGFLYDSIEDITVDGIFSYRQRNPKATFRMPSFFFAN